MSKPAKFYPVVESYSEGRVPPRLFHLLWLLLVALALLWARLWYLQIAQGEQLAQQAAAVRTRFLRVSAPRGIIQDRNGIPLATNRFQFVVSVLPDALRKKPEHLRVVANLLKTPEAELWAAVRNPQINPYVPLVVASGLPLELAAQLMENRYNLPEVEVTFQPLRWYPQGKAFAHLIGYVGQISPQELKEFKAWDSPKAAREGMEPSAPLYDGSDFVGKNGMERQYERYLHGLPGGERIEVTPRGKRVRTLEEVEPVPGAQVVLSVDARLQRRAYELLQGHQGALVALDPRTGEVLTLVSQPSFDPNLFVGRLPLELWKRLSRDPRYPLQNRAVQSAYAPGSTIKPLNALQALHLRVLSPYSRIRCGGGYRLGTRFFRCWRRHGRVDFYRAIAQSCDTFFYLTAHKLGPEALAAIARQFNLGERTNLDLPHEGRGLVPDPAWKRQRWHQPWYGGETLNYGIGQGYLQVTPLQMAVVAATLANRGVVPQPHLVRLVLSSDGKRLYEAKPKGRRIPIERAHWEAVIEGMRRAVTEGTAHGCQLPGISIAGKTGSAEFRKGGKTHAWFIAFAPVENPKVALCVMAEEAGHGGEVAVPIAREWLKAFFENER